LLRRDYDEIQIREVADHAGVALGTLYRYFVSKEHLFAAALVKWGAALRSRVQRGPVRSPEIAGQLVEVYLRAIDAFERRPQFFRTLMAIESSTDTRTRELWAEFGEATSEAFSAPLASLPPDQAAAISQTLLPVLHGALRAWANGALTIDDTRGRVTQAITLIFSAPPTPEQTG
jgi:TetR/AcrR family transcriptional regulator, cholesterol catabolism regulator